MRRAEEEVGKVIRKKEVEQLRTGQRRMQTREKEKKREIKLH